MTTPQPRIPQQHADSPASADTAHKTAKPAAALTPDDTPAPAAASTESAASPVAAPPAPAVLGQAADQQVYDQPHLDAPAAAQPVSPVIPADAVPVAHEVVSHMRPARRGYTHVPIAGEEPESEQDPTVHRRPSARTRGERAARPARRAVTEPAGGEAPKGKLTPKLMVELAAPHTWAASTMPVLLAICLSIADTAVISVSTAIILLVICILMQSAVNTINDYFDYVKGTDTADNQDDPTDAVLVYNEIDPRKARNLALGLLAVAFLLGIFIILRAGWIPLVIALVGVIIVFLYSGGRTPISYLPIGEVVSGVTMGGLITLACYQALTLTFSWTVLLYAIPPMIGVALIMFTNNTCDIEKDIEADRKTLPVLLGRSTSVAVYRALMVLWMAAIAVFVLYGYPRGWYGLLFMVAAYGPVLGIFRNPFTAASRGGGMAQIGAANVILGMTYALCLLLSTAAFPVL